MAFGWCHMPCSTEHAICTCLQLSTAAPCCPTCSQTPSPLVAPLPILTGPPPLMTAVHLAVARLNGGACSGGAEGAYLELHKEAVEL